MKKSCSVNLAPKLWVASTLVVSVLVAFPPVASMPVVFVLLVSASFVLAVGSRADPTELGPGGSERASGARVQECGDGTMMDAETGYQWEMKHVSDGVADFSNPHDVDNEYTWTSLEDGNAENSDGTLFAVFLKKLNKADDAT